MSYIEDMPKTIDANGCWIPSREKLFSDKDGYIVFNDAGYQYRLHRVTMSAKYQVDYFNLKNLPRHSKDCDNACFNPEHILIGTQRDNMRDRILHGNNPNLNKTCCSKCGGPYTTVKYKSGPQKGKRYRRCRECVNRQRAEFKERSGY